MVAEDMTQDRHSYYNEERTMFWIYSLAILVLTVPGAVVNTLLLIERRRKRGHTHD